jgi:hypothetical protein
MTVPCPILPVRITGPLGGRLRDGLLDSGADETVLDPTLAPLIGVDLLTGFVWEINLVGRGRVRCRYAPVQLRITDGIRETYEWDAIAAFTPFPLVRNLLGFGGFLQFFDASFLGADEKVILTPNNLFAGRRI